jgi:hypothetical protein
VQFDVTANYVDEQSGEQRYSNLVGFGHPDLIYVTRGHKSNLFIDATFSICPKGFEQLLILMAFSAADDMYVPVMFVLMQSKHSTIYYRAIQEIICACDWKIDPITISCDFELAIMNNLKLQFNNCDIVGCLFHFKQALRRKLISLQVDQAIISNLIGKEGLINLLCFVRVDEIKSKGYSILILFIVYCLIV